MNNIESPRPARIYLIGYRGAGKSTIGPLLAQRLNWAFADTDDEIISATQKSIAELFSNGGEPEFRAVESATLSRLSQRADLVIATGGGIVLQNDNRTIISKTGFPIWLRASAATLFHRIQNDPGTLHRRPHLVAGGSLEEVEQLLAVREPLYGTVAKMTVETDLQSPEEIVSTILASC